MEKLKDSIELRNIGYPVTATIIIRTRKKAMYYRSDGCYEVFKIVIAPAQIVFGKSYPKREVYPGNEDFGFTAWCFHDETTAYKKYKEI